VSAQTPRSAQRLAQVLLTDWLAERHRELGMVGVAGAFVFPSGAVVSAAHGFADREQSIPMKSDTRLRLASITKLFTVTAMLIARDEGLLSLEAPVSDLVPELATVTSPAPDQAPVTLRQVVSHTAGLPHDLPYGVNYWDRTGTDVVFPPASEAREYLRGLRLISPPMSNYHYSNVSFMVAGLAVEAAFGRPYEEVIRTRVLAPLGMEDAFFWSTDAIGTLARGYRLEGSDLVPAPNMNVGWDTAGGALCSSVDDLARFIKLHLSDLPVGGRQILRGSSVREAQQPVFMLPGWRAGMGLGWRMKQAYGETLLSHAGGIAGFSAHLVLIPALGVGGVLLANTNTGHVHMLLEGMLESVVRVLRTEEEAAQFDQESGLGRPTEPMTGHYTSYEASYDVVAANGRLALVSHGALDSPAWLEPSGDDGHFIAGTGALQGEPVVFTELVDGRYTELTMSGLRLRRT
jgi:CubicO group peptidase (beta-lactamase class C family)